MRLFTVLITLSVSSAALAQNLATNPAVKNRILKEAESLPVYFMTTEDGMAPLAAAMNEQMISFQHPSSLRSPVKAGLRFMPISRKNMQKTLAPLLQDGDIVLSFRSEWANGGAYPSVQMGVSHAGMIYKNGTTISNIDYPLNAEYVGNLDTKHYKETPLLHVVRPKGLSKIQKDNLNRWAKLFVSQKNTIYPNKISFNPDYSAPRFDATAKEPLSFVKDVARHALGVKASSQTVFCSEFVWVLLSLKDCHPEMNKTDFAAAGIPSCVNPSFKPLPALGDYAQSQNDADQAGLADGPLLMLQKLQLENSEMQKEISSVFAASATSRMSTGHRAVAEEFAPLFAPLEGYYKTYDAHSLQVDGIKKAFNSQMKPNYSPTAYMVNTLLPEANDHRVLDYVTTLVFID